MAVIFIIIISAIIFVDYRINRKLINVITVVSVPYLILIPLNNWIMQRNGFYPISDQVILMILVGIVCIFLGSLIADFRKRVSKTHKIEDYEQNFKKFKYYKISKMSKYCFCVDVVVFLRLLFIIASRGLRFLPTEQFAGMLFTGPLGHLFLTIYPLVPMLFYYWLNHRKEKKILFLVLFSIALIFFTFIKYHIIGIVVSIYIFVSFENHSYIKKGAILVSSAAVIIFVLNYFFGFYIRGTNSLVGANYYYNHLWNYMSGSLIYDNLIFTEGTRVGVSTLYKVGSFIAPPLNVLLSVFGITIFPHEPLPFRTVASNGERGNVIDAIGYLFPSKGSIFEIVLFGLVLIIIGFVFTLIYNRALRRKNALSVGICLFLTFFVFFSFFGTFYIHLVPWEILFWSAIMPRLFDRRIKFK